MKLRGPTLAAVLAITVVAVAVVLLAMTRLTDRVTFRDRPDVAVVDLSCAGCNVIFLNIELLRGDHVGLIAGNSDTPAIDGFFDRGMIFHDVSAPAGETFLSNTAVLTVTPPHSIDVRAIEIDKFEQLDVARRREIEDRLVALESIAETLAGSGYRTVSINQGGRAGAEVYLDRGFADISQWSSDVLFEDMVSVLLEKLAEPRNQPLFLLFRPTFLHNHQYRNPGVGMDWDHALIRTRQYEYESPAGVMRTGVLLRRRRDVSADREAQAEREIYRAQLRYGDASLDKVLDRLEDDYAGNSIIVLYANHGSGLGDNGVYRHGTAYQSSIHVPLLIRHPAVREAIHVRRPVQLLDLVPAIVEMTMPADEQETDAIERLLGIAGDPDAETIIFGRNSFDEFVRRGDWKLIIKYGRIKMLFNLRDDPGEAVNQIESRTDVARELERLLLEHRRNLLSKLIIPSVDAGLPG